MVPMNDGLDPQDAAISRRLAKLGAMPVDTSRLERALRAQIPAPARRPARWRSLAAIAASLLLFVAFGIGLLQGRPAQASPDLMARMYQDIVSGKVETIPAQSIEEVNRTLAAMSGTSITLPQPPPSQLMACCMQTIGDKKVACVLLQNAGTPVTMVVAKDTDVKSPSSPLVERHGIGYHVHAVGDLQMVMTERDHHWICLMGHLPQEKLMDLAEAIHF